MAWIRSRRCQDDKPKCKTFCEEVRCCIPRDPGALIDFAGLLGPIIITGTSVTPSFVLIPWEHDPTVLAEPVVLPTPPSPPATLQTANPTLNPIQTGIFNARSRACASNPVLTLFLLNPIPMGAITSPVTITGRLYVNGVATSVSASVTLQPNPTAPIPPGPLLTAVLQSVTGSGTAFVPPGGLMQVVVTASDEIFSLLGGDDIHAEFTYNLRGGGCC